MGAIVMLKPGRKFAAEVVSGYDTGAISYRLGLYVNNVTPNAVTSVPADFTEATFGGYGRITLGSFGAITDVLLHAICSNPPVSFTASGAGPAQTVYGLLLYENNRNIMVAAMLLDTPVSAAGAGLVITVTAILRQASVWNVGPSGGGPANFIRLPQNGRLYWLAWLKGVASSRGFTYKLFKNNVQPTATSVLGDFVEATFTGYASQDAGAFAAAVENPDNANCQAPTLTWTATGSTPGETVYGYYVVYTLAPTVLLMAEKYISPADMSYSGAQCAVTPTIDQYSEY